MQVIDIIARGAFGNVIQVCSVHDKQIYAMKIMSKSQIVKDSAVQQVKGKFNKHENISKEKTK
jgi:serine/threonine protein kinase